MSRLRVLFCNHTGKCSGAERVLLDTLAALDTARYDRSVACPTDADLAELIRAQGVPVHAVPALKARFTSDPRVLLGYLRSFAGNMRGFRKLVRAVAPDLLYANTVRAGIVTTLATIGTGIPIVWHVHDDLPAHPISAVIRLTAFLSRRTRLLAVSQATAVAFAGGLPFGARLGVLYNGIDLDRFTFKTGQTERPTALRDELGLTEDDLLLSAVGMINPRKGLGGLLDAFRIVADGNPRAHLAIVGAPIFNRDDLYLEQLKEQSRRLQLTGRVHFTGPRKDIPVVLRSSDLIILNALVEPFGLIVVEAMCSGTPILATRVGGIPEIVTDNENGFLVEPNQTEALAARLIAVLDDPAARARVASAAILHVRPRFSRQRYANDVLAYFENFVRGCSSTAPSTIQQEAQ